MKKTKVLVFAKIRKMQQGLIAEILDGTEAIPQYLRNTQMQQLDPVMFKMAPKIHGNQTLKDEPAQLQIKQIQRSSTSRLKETGNGLGHSRTGINRSKINMSKKPSYMSYNIPNRKKNQRMFPVDQS